MVPFFSPFSLSKDTWTTQSISGNSLAAFSVLPHIYCLKTWQLDWPSAVTWGSLNYGEILFTFLPYNP